MKIRQASAYKKDLKLCKKRHYNIKLLDDILKLYVTNNGFSEEDAVTYYDHPLNGTWKGHRSFHPYGHNDDWVVIYHIEGDILVLDDVIMVLDRTGTHSDIYGKTTLNAAIELHDTLNPKIWNEDNSLRPDVREKLNEIVDEFAASIDIPLSIIDAHIVGSNASYNYTEYSDLDLHCIVNFARLDADPSVIEAWMWAQKKLFNDEYDISIRGIDVEVYVEDVGSNTMSNGIYSLFEDRWIKFPEPIEVDIDEQAVDAEVKGLIPYIENDLQNGTLAEVEDRIDQLYMIRKNGLATDGEFGIGNQTFKELRNLGYLDALKDRVTELRSDELSIFAKSLK